MGRRADPERPHKREKAKPDEPLAKSDILAFILAALSYLLPVFAAVLLVLLLIWALAHFF